MREGIDEKWASIENTVSQGATLSEECHFKLKHMYYIAATLVLKTVLEASKMHPSKFRKTMKDKKTLQAYFLHVWSQIMPTLRTQFRISQEEQNALQHVFFLGLADTMVAVRAAIAGKAADECRAMLDEIVPSIRRYTDDLPRMFDTQSDSGESTQEV